ncbi:MFS transporter [Burkholderia plantarii]|nr:MFS transporter [Burkholderia plantarii]
MRIGGSLLAGLFVAYLDRLALSVGLCSIARDFGFAGPNMAATASWPPTAFLIGYAVANVLGGALPRRRDPKYVAAWTFALWSVATFHIGMTNSITVLLICRVLLRIGEGIYWPQQSRFATAWFAPNERTKANAVIQYYGQFLALAIGFMLLTPLYDASGRRVLFYIAGGLGLLVIVPLYLAMLKPQSEARYPPPKRGSIASKLMPGALAARPMARRAASPSARQPLPRGFAFSALPIAIRSRRGHRSHGRYPSRTRRPDSRAARAGALSERLREARSRRAVSIISTASIRLQY